MDEQEHKTQPPGCVGSESEVWEKEGGEATATPKAAEPSDFPVGENF